MDLEQGRFTSLQQGRQQATKVAKQATKVAKQAAKVAKQATKLVARARGDKGNQSRLENLDLR